MEPGRPLSGPRVPKTTPGWFLRPGPSAVSRRLTSSSCPFDMAASAPKEAATRFLVGSPSFSFQSPQHQRPTQPDTGDWFIGGDGPANHHSPSVTQPAAACAAESGFDGGGGWFWRVCPVPASLLPFRPGLQLTRRPLPLASRALVPRTRRSVSFACPPQPARVATLRGAAARAAAAGGLGLPPAVSPRADGAVATRRMRRAHPQHAPPPRRRVPVGHAIGWGAAGGPAVGHTLPPPSRCGPPAAEPVAAGLWVLSPHPHAAPLLSGRH